MLQGCDFFFILLAGQNREIAMPHQSNARLLGMAFIIVDFLWNVRLQALT